MRPTRTWALLPLALAAVRAVPAQQPTPPPPDTTLATGVAAGESSGEPARRRFVKWNELDGPFTTFRFGGGILVDYVTYAQDAESEAQFALAPEVKIRDTRVILSGRLKTTRPITWQAGLMYDGPSSSWFVRQTGIMVAIPEWWGHVFVGRAKEGTSLNRVMTGYDGWTMERFPFSESIPLLADGVKWLGYLPNRHLIWNLGVFTDWLSEGQSFSSYDHQIAGRVAWVPMVSDSSGTLLHLGLNFRTGKPNEGQLQVRARPEAFPAPYFVDTGKIPSTSSSSVGFEAYWRPGPWLFGSEYYVQTVRSPEMGNPLLHGGDAVAILLLTGETRSYNTVGGYFRGVSPKRTVFEGGPGAWEALLRLSYTDLTDGPVEGGTFWRITPMLNWHLTDGIRLELAYGYGVLDRFGKEGTTQFFQTRLQTEF